MVESQVRGVEIWGRYSIPVRNLIHSGMSCGAGNLMLAVSYGKHGCRYHMSGPAPAPGVSPGPQASAMSATVGGSCLVVVGAWVWNRIRTLFVRKQDI